MNIEIDDYGRDGEEGRRGERVSIQKLENLVCTELRSSGDLSHLDVKLSDPGPSQIEDELVHPLV